LPHKLVGGEEVSGYATSFSLARCPAEPELASPPVTAAVASIAFTFPFNIHKASLKRHQIIPGAAFALASFSYAFQLSSASITLRFCRWLPGPCSDRLLSSCSTSRLCLSFLGSRLWPSSSLSLSYLSRHLVFANLLYSSLS
jgi:hypothetical protein